MSRGTPGSPFAPTPSSACPTPAGPARPTFVAVSVSLSPAPGGHRLPVKHSRLWQSLPQGFPHHTGWSGLATSLAAPLFLHSTEAVTSCWHLWVNKNTGTAWEALGKGEGLQGRALSDQRRFGFGDLEASPVKTGCTFPPQTIPWRKWQKGGGHYLGYPCP